MILSAQIFWQQDDCFIIHFAKASLANNFTGLALGTHTEALEAHLPSFQEQFHQFILQERIEILKKLNTNCQL